MIETQTQEAHALMVADQAGIQQELGLAGLEDAEVRKNGRIAKRQHAALAVARGPELDERPGAHLGPILRRRHIVGRRVFCLNAPKPPAACGRTSPTPARVDRARHREIHLVDVHHGRMGNSRRSEGLLVGIAHAKQQIVAEREAKASRDVVQERARPEDVRVVAHHEQTAAVLDETLDRSDFVF